MSILVFEFVFGSVVVHFLRLLNESSVAVTRARHLIVVVGCKRNLEKARRLVLFFFKIKSFERFLFCFV
jgi:hypothetical protein